MQPVFCFRFVAACFLTFALYAPAQTPPPPAQAHAEGLPLRASPGDYQAHKQVGDVTIAADFTGHFVTMPDKMLTTDDYVIVEVALFGPQGSKLVLSPDQFSLRVNAKKPSPGEPSVMANSSLRDPDWQPPEEGGAKKEKTAIQSSAGGGGAGGLSGNDPPPPVHIPLDLQRSMADRALKASLEEGERPLPQAGLLYFHYGGKAKGVHTVELLYNGPAGKATIELHP
jgi:hypothetical protein